MRSHVSMKATETTFVFSVIPKMKNSKSNNGDY